MQSLSHEALLNVGIAIVTSGPLAETEIGCEVDIAVTKLLRPHPPRPLLASNSPDYSVCWHAQYIRRYVPRSRMSFTQRAPTSASPEAANNLLKVLRVLPGIPRMTADLP